MGELQASLHFANVAQHAAGQGTCEAKRFQTRQLNAKWVMTQIAMRSLPPDTHMRPGVTCQTHTGRRLALVSHRALSTGVKQLLERTEWLLEDPAVQVRQASAAAAAASAAAGRHPQTGAVGFCALASQPPTYCSHLPTSR